MSPPVLEAPRGVLKPERPTGRVDHERFAPSPRLAPFVAHFWTVRWDLRGAPPFLAETLPHPCVHITFERGRAQVGGVATARFRRRLSGQGRVFGIKFRPAAFRPILGAPLSRLTDRQVSLRSLFGRDSDALARAILEAPQVSRCVALAEALLADRLPAMPAAIAELRNLVERLATDGRFTRVEQVAAFAGLTRRQLQRRFLAAVGVSPKWVLQRYRLHEAALLLGGPNPPELASLALRLGYFDQAHFSRDFKAMVGRTPGAYAAS
ncbi:MAG: DUF6597 domain-containing transcriptional factor [Deltaproteobacteria bacterium]